MKNHTMKVFFISFFLIFWGVGKCIATNYILSPDSKVVFEYKDFIHIETYYWPETMLSYRISFEDNVNMEDLVLVNCENGEEVEYQLSDIKKENDNLMSCKIHFMATLPSNGSYSYELCCRPSERKAIVPMKILQKESYYEVFGDKIQLRIPITSESISENVPAPILSMNVGNDWMGCNRIKSKYNRILSYHTEIVENGPLYSLFKISYRFSNGGEYQANVKLVKNYPFAVLDESMTNLSKSDEIVMEMEWNGFNPVKRFGTHWDRTLESNRDMWMGIEQPIYTSYSKEDPRWTGTGWIENPAEKMIFRISPFGGNSVREQVPVMSFWEEGNSARELGIFVYDFNRWNDRQYGIWQPTPDLSVYFRFQNHKLFFTYPLISGTRSTAVSLFPVNDGEKRVAEFNDKLSSLLEHNVYMQNGSLHHKNDPKDLYYRYSQILMMRYALLSLDRIKDWQLMYPEDARRPENPFKSRSASSAENFYKKMLTSAMSYYPVGLNCYPGVHSIEHRILYSEFVEDYLRYYKVLTESQRQTVEALFILGGYVNMLEAMNPIRHSLAGTANMAADGWCIPLQISFLFPDHPMAKEWADFYEKELELNGLFYTRPDVKQYESFGGRWVESLGIYNWAFLRPVTHSNIAGEMYDGKNRFASRYMASRGRWMVDMLTAPVYIHWNKKLVPDFYPKGWNPGDSLTRPEFARCYPPHGAHSKGFLVPTYMPYFQLAEWMENYDPLLSEHLFWLSSAGDEVEKKKTDTDWNAPYLNMHPIKRTGTNPHLKSTKYTGHGIVLRAGVDTPEELSIHLNQVDKGPNYRWGNQGEGNTGGIYFYAQGQVFTGHENEIAGDHVVNNLDGLTNFGVMKDGEFRTIGMNELKAPLYDFGVAQFAELLSDGENDKYVWPEYLSRSVMLAGTDYFILFDEVGTNWRASTRFSWFNVNGKEFPKIIFLSSYGRKGGWMAARTENSRGFYRDSFESLLTLVTHKKKEVNVEGGKYAIAPILKDSDIAEFIPSGSSSLPQGVFHISTGKSSDIVFRDRSEISYVSETETFEGKAGLIRRFGADSLILAMFKGSHIAADGLDVRLESKGRAAIALTRNFRKELNGTLKTEVDTELELSGLFPGGTLYIDGIRYGSTVSGSDMRIHLSKGEYTLEYTEEAATPMSSRIIRTEYEKNRVKLFVESPTCRSVRIELSYDGGKTWKIKGKTSKGLYFLPNEKEGKIHVRAVSCNGNKCARYAPEYPIYFTAEPPHYPEGLWLKLNEGQVELNWGTVLGVQEYRLYRRKQGDENFEMIYRGKENTYTDTNVPGIQKAYVLPGSLDNKEQNRMGLVVYEYAVTAVNGRGESRMSPVENTDPASWRNWYPDTELKFKRQSAFWMPPYTPAEKSPERYYPD